MAPGGQGADEQEDQDDDQDDSHDIFLLSSFLISIKTPFREEKGIQAESCRFFMDINGLEMFCMRSNKSFRVHLHSTGAAMFHPGKEYSRLFHDQIILYGFDPLDAPYDFTRFIHGLLRINEAAQLNDALVSFDTDLE